MKRIFINLPVRDPEKSKSFYTQLGFANFPFFTGENQICMAWSEEIMLMLQSKEFFKLGSNKSTANTENSLSASFTLPVESTDAMNETIRRGLLAGGREPMALIDEVYMQIRTIEDLDGHYWSIIYLDIEQFKGLNNDR